jgi:DSBA-like thioredoxin domain-containing protein
MNMVVHPDVVQLAHQYTCAAAKQKKFLEYKHAFWEKSFGAYAASGGKDRASLGEGAILQYAPSFGADPAKLKTDANSAECKQRVAEDMAELAKFHVNGTPAFFINGKHIGGGIPKEAFKQIIAEKLAIAEASKVPGAEYYAKEIMGKGVHEFRSKRDAAKAAPAPGPAEQAPGAGSAAKPAGAGSAAKPAGPGAGSAAKP